MSTPPLEKKHQCFSCGESITFQEAIDHSCLETWPASKSEAGEIASLLDAKNSANIQGWLDRLCGGKYYPDARTPLQRLYWWKIETRFKYLRRIGVVPWPISYYTRHV